MERSKKTKSKVEKFLEGLNFKELMELGKAAQAMAEAMKTSEGGGMFKTDNLADFQSSYKESFTKLIDKEHSPLVMRKITKYGFPIWASMITDNNLSDLDEVVINFMEANKEEGWVNDIQALRNLAGELTEHLVKTYDKTEGVAVLFYVDKMFISSLFGDFMNHTACRIEYYTLLQYSTGV